ncbi:MAG: YlmH/Sll1252 family protein [Clostridiaceae bacterium]|nr:YlmH/Sll1252 family protein [Clostridiaceae bacterium]
MEELELLGKRCRELFRRAQTRGEACCTEFLTLAEQDIARRTGADALAGGYAGAERRVAVFGGGEGDAPVVCLHIAPKQPKFAELLTHRDLLGALMSLGLRRSLFGDLLPGENGWYLFCLQEQSGYVAENLTQARHTSLTVQKTADLPPTAQPPEPSPVVVASERLDVLLAAVWKLSRSEGRRVVEEGLVFINGRACEDAAAQLKPGDMVTVRGTGRFGYEGIERETKKGRLRVLVRIYR